MMNHLNKVLCVSFERVSPFSFSPLLQPPRGFRAFMAAELCMAENSNSCYCYGNWQGIIMQVDDTVLYHSHPTTVRGIFNFVTIAAR